MTASRVARTLALAIFIVSPAATVSAQERQPLSEILPELIGNTIILTPTRLPDAPNHQAHFQPGVEQTEAPLQFNQALVGLLSTYPLGSSSGGFTYTYDPTVGTFTRTSDSFGPAFAERALTVGREKVSFGFGYQHATYDSFEGKQLRHRDIRFFVRHIDCCGRVSEGESVPDGSHLTPAFEGDLVEASLALDLSTDTFVFFTNYGVTDRFDIGAAIPFVRVSLDASIRARIDRLATARTPSTHAFDGPDPDERTFRMAGEAAGLGDVVVRGKYNFFRHGSSGLAMGLDVRVPTGDEGDLLGTGAVQTKVFGIASHAFGRFSPHLNAGYTFSSKSALPDIRLSDEVNYSAGFDLALTPHVTFAADLVGRFLRDARRMREVDRVFEFIPTGTGGGTGGGGGGGGGGMGPRPVEVETATRSVLQFEDGDLNLMLGTAGVRFNPIGNLLISANLLFPLTSAGLRDRVTPVIGFDYAF